MAAFPLHETVSLAESAHKNCSKMRSFVEYRPGHKNMHEIRAKLMTVDGSIC